MKYKVIRDEHGRSNEVILEADTLDELARLAQEKTGRKSDNLGVGLESDLGFDTNGEGLL